MKKIVKSSFRIISLIVKSSFLIIGLVVSVYLGLVIVFMFWPNRLMFFPSSVIKETPRNINLTYKEVYIPIGKQKLNAWWIESHNLNSPVLLYLHGNGGNIGDYSIDSKFFHDLGISVLFIDYRGYGHSTGDFPTEKSVYEDAEVAWKYLVEERKISAKNIFIYGYSLGSAIAIELAKQHQNNAGLIIESSFTSIKELIDYYQIPLPNTNSVQYFDSITKVKSLHIPILFIHGSADEFIPPYMSNKLFMASSGPKSLLIISGATHSNALEKGGSIYRQAVFNFIKNRQNLRSLKN